MSIDPGPRFAEVERWHRAGFEALERGDPEGALAASGELLRLLHASGYELAALAHLAAGRDSHAVEALETGVAAAPGVWVLWKRLGDAQLAAGRVEDAQRSYDRALACPAVDAAAVQLARAQGMYAASRAEAALAALASVPPGGRVLEFAECAARALLALGRAFEARDAAQRALDSPAAEDAGPAMRAQLQACFAEALIALDERAAASIAAREALALERGHPRALWCLREAEGRRVEGARAFELLLEGRFTRAGEGGAGSTGVRTSYRVVAKGETEAFDLARALEPESVRAHLALAEALCGPARSDLPIGVYAVSEYEFFDPAAEIGRESP